MPHPVRSGAITAEGFVAAARLHGLANWRIDAKALGSLGALSDMVTRGHRDLFSTAAAGAAAGPGPGKHLLAMLESAEAVLEPPLEEQVRQPAERPSVIVHQASMVISLLVCQGEL
jgi:hypothetical protein